MSDLIEALQIFLKYGDPKYPTCCQHDILQVMIDVNLVSDEDKARLKELSFNIFDGYFTSYRFGSA